MYGRRMIHANSPTRVLRALAAIRVQFWQTSTLSIVDSASPVFIGRTKEEAMYDQATAPMLADNTTYERILSPGEEIWATCQDQAFVHFIIDYWPFTVPAANTELADVRELR